MGRSLPLHQIKLRAVHIFLCVLVCVVSFAVTSSAGSFGGFGPAQGSAGAGGGGPASFTDVTLDKIILDVANADFTIRRVAVEKLRFESLGGDTGSVDLFLDSPTEIIWKAQITNPKYSFLDSLGNGMAYNEPTQTIQPVGATQTLKFGDSSNAIQYVSGVMNMPQDKPLTFGASQEVDANIRWDTDTEDKLSIESQSHTVFGPPGSATSAQNYGHSETDNSVIFHSSTLAASATDEWLSLKHDVTDAVITTGKGDLVLAPASGTVDLSDLQAATLSASDGTLAMTIADSTGVVTFAASPTAPTGGTMSEVFGAGATAAGDDASAFGEGATAAGEDSVAVGSNASAAGAQSTAIGEASNASQANSVSIGRLATCSGSQSLAAGARSAAVGNSVALGFEAVAAAAGQFVCGSPAVPITAMFIGEGVSSDTPQDLSWHATAASADAAPGNLAIIAGNAFPGGTGIANDDGSPLILSGGIGNSYYTVADWTQGATETITITVVTAAGSTATVLTNGTDYTAVTSNDATSILIAAEIDALSGVSASASSAEVLITPDVGTYSLVLAASLDAFVEDTQGAAGQILGPDGTVALPGWSFANDPATGIGLAAPGFLVFAAGGGTKLQISTGGVTVLVPINVSDIELDTISAADGVQAMSVASSTGNVTFAAAVAMDTTLGVTGTFTALGAADFDSIVSFKSAARANDDVTLAFGTGSDRFLQGESGVLTDDAATEFCAIQSSLGDAGGVIIVYTCKLTDATGVRATKTGTLTIATLDGAAGVRAGIGDVGQLEEEVGGTTTFTFAIDDTDDGDLEITCLTTTTLSPTDISITWTGNVSGDVELLAQ